ncbi:Golgi-specific brefeldin A-resistance guanine nucleotide exchange factor 1 isoform X2 [Latimeria chalumnae]|uniref:Golgi-specific brefeldin A-resistance guanine nucleotide exchange factor 1 isoform X2 n=1 Tax=Latimeria chalumnae TaxID=7897 RepID=UPI0003C17A89|nr:PREDICTED: Golgi-specific brefeldin A-resistance guanine nucleotide exchange factor 1 isoform X2 [Latimeria chalumnae]|eukprot:XP_005995194.1 PREDICTED: Golgi-specific brefeldin A-resistance guanine nucleotide exchange factor 1 isoform X2 [Latimeria chalumnae]
MGDKKIYIVQGEITTVVGAIKRNARWSTHMPLDEEQDPLLYSFSHLKEVLNSITELSEVEPNVFLRPFLEVIRSEDTTGPITGLALRSVNKFLSYGLIDPSHEGAAEGIENMADAVTHARFVGTDPASDEVVLMKILQVLRTLLLTPVGAHLTNESVCEIMQSCFRICFEMRLSELLRKSAEHTLFDMVQLLFSRLPEFKEEAKSYVGANMKKISSCLLNNMELNCGEQHKNINQLERLKMRAGGMSDSSKWKKQKRSPRPPRHATKVLNAGDQQSVNGQVLQSVGNGSTISNSVPGGVPFLETSSQSVFSSISSGVAENTSSISSPSTDSGFELSSKTTSKDDLTDLDQVSSLGTTPATTPSSEHGSGEHHNQPEPQVGGIQNEAPKAKIQSASVESIPEILEDRDSFAEHSDTASVHDMDYVNPRGVRFTQSSHREGAALVPYSLPCIRELFRFLISLTNPHDRHNSEVMMHMGLQLLIVALESAPVANYVSLLSLVKDELCRHIFQLLSVERVNLYASSLRVCFLLFESTRGHLKFQLEMYLKKLMDIITSENPKMPYEMKEMALEAIVQLWRIQSFVTELYINYDCDYYCSNLFEDLTKLLSKNAFPVSGQLYTTHLLSLEALLTVIDSTEAHCQAKVLNNAVQQDKKETTKSTMESTGSSSKEDSNGTKRSSSDGKLPGEAEMSVPCPPTSGCLMADKMKVGRQDLEDSETAEKKPPKKPARFSSSIPNAQELAKIKNKKKLLIAGTEQFNQKPKKGIQFLQEKGLLASPMDNNEVAQWLRENPRLDKKMIGEFVSDRKNIELLESFVGTFTFPGLRIDEALRSYLEAFRLPGEAPVIQRLLEAFTDYWHKANGSPFATNDACFALAYAVIMLNTDQHNHNVRKQNIPMTLEEFRKNLKGVNGGKDFDQDMLEDIYNAIKNDEIVMPEEQTGLVKENYLWNVLLHRGGSPEGIFLHVPPGTYDHDLFTMTWGPTIAAISYVFDKSLDETIIQKAISGFRKCAMISAHYGLSDVFDNLIISLCKFTTLSSETVENLPSVFGSNTKAQNAAKTVFNLAHRHGDILREGWKNIMDSMLQLFRAELLPKAMVEVEDFVEPNGKISLQREETPSNRGESSVLSFVSWLTLSGTEQTGLRGPSTENQEAKQTALDCIKQCDPEKLITESKFLQLESLQELMKALISVTPDEEMYDEEDAAFCLEMLLRVVLENRDRVSCVWQTVRDHLYHLCAHATENCFLVERAVVGLLRLAIRLLRREEISPQVLLSLRILLMMKPNVLSRVSRQVSFGLHELLKTNAANIHSNDDWYTLFTLLECIGAGVKPPPALQVTARTDSDTGAQSDSEISSYHPSEVSLDRGYTSDSEVYTEHGKHSKMHRSITDVDMANSGWLVVGKEDLDSSNKPVSSVTKQGPWPLVNQYSLTLGEDMGPHDTKSLIKCVESLSFIVRDAAHVTPENFELCVKTIRIFVEASLNGGYKSQDKKSKSHKHESKSNRFRKKPKEKESSLKRSKVSSQRPARSHSDDEEDESVPASYHTVSLQLLDLMHTLHTRAASIYSSWAEEQRHLDAADKKIEADSKTLWSNCWCPLLQGIAWLCCDARRQVRTQALTYLQRALLAPDLQSLHALEWESCFNKVLFPLLTKLLESISPADVVGMEETRMRASTLLSKVFLQHLSPLLSLPTFAALWLTILDFMDKYMHAGSSDLLLEAIPESLKNMLLVMDTAGIFHSADSRTGYSDLWEITWERIDCFLPRLKDELFKQTVIQDPAPSVLVEPLSQKPVQPSPIATTPISPALIEPKMTSQQETLDKSAELSVNESEKSTTIKVSSVSPTTTPISTPVKMSPVTEVPPPITQSPLILQPLASPLQVGVPPMSLPIILNPALIEATSPVPLLSTPRPADPAPTSEVN